MKPEVNNNRFDAPADGGSSGAGQSRLIDEALSLAYGRDSRSAADTAASGNTNGDTAIGGNTTVDTTTGTANGAGTSESDGFLDLSAPVPGLDDNPLTRESAPARSDTLADGSDTAAEGNDASLDGSDTSTEGDDASQDSPDAGAELPAEETQSDETPTGDQPSPSPERVEPRTPIRRMPDILPGSDAPLVPGEYTTRTVMVNGVPRTYNVYTPHSYSRENGDVVMALDGLTIRNPNGGMATTNGWNETAERHGFLAVYPQPGTRAGGHVNAWNPGLLNPTTPGDTASGARGTERLGTTAPRPESDDVDYLRAVIEDLRRLTTVNEIHAVTFSEGSLPIQHAQARLPEGTFTSVTYVGGTTLGDTPTPRPGTDTLVIHGDQDGTLPYTGGAAGRTRFLAWLGHRAASDSSRPDTLVTRAAEANDLDVQETTENPNFRLRRFLSSNPDNPTTATEYLVRGGGHSWFGRRTGGSNESWLSRFNGPTIGRDRFDMNEIIARHFGLDRPLPLRRLLGRGNPVPAGR